MIVDDDEDITNLFQTFLEYDGYKVDTFTDPIDALYSFRKNIYDLGLLDLKMPKMNGIILSRKLKNIDHTLLFRFITSHKGSWILLLLLITSYTMYNLVIYK